MNPVYLDIHIHTSDNPDALNQNYAVDTILNKIEDVSQNADCLISFTDHNTINKKVYCDILSKGVDKIHLLLGVELHIKNFAEAPAYHCHILFKNEITEECIDNINEILDKLYPQKVVDKMDPGIPSLDRIVKAFDAYEFILLPHGGQGHATFDTSIPRGKKFDTVMEKSVYYNQFEGYTARSQNGLEETLEYFQRLGIRDFISLVTCTDNYKPEIYPNSKNRDAPPFVPTWMFAEPSFDGLRLSLSEESRFLYQEEKPEVWSEYIKTVELHNDKIDVDVNLSSGLNVVIGGSSSGKTLFVDSLFRKLSHNQGSFDNSEYNSYNVSALNVYNPSGVSPHYISQNYIMKVVNNESSDKLENIDIIKSIFPDDPSFKEKIVRLLNNFQKDVTDLIEEVSKIEQLEKELRAVPHFGKLILLTKIPQNIYRLFEPTKEISEKIDYNDSKMQSNIELLDSIKNTITENPFFNEQILINFENIAEEIKRLNTISNMHSEILVLVTSAIKEFKLETEGKNAQEQVKKEQIDSLVGKIEEYVKMKILFKKKLEKISTYSFKADSREIISMGHKLYIENKFTLSKDIILNTFNEYLNNKIQKYESIIPEMLFKSNFKQRPKVDTYEKFIEKVCNALKNENKNRYKIVTKDGKDYDNLSPGWKTSIILDLVLGYEDDFAPIIIDQPEDNLATSYINDGLVKAIKETKKRKQIILVSHNATIPMIADAQTIVYCVNKNSKIKIKSAPMEGEIDGKKVVDLIARITDGGKPSIKKRVKKYDLKRFN
ncbi:ATPase [Fibrobacter sp. UWB12]|uniref:ATPase n=1 Tax=Fibrobacter sp. UWB12 TaxID=1896203 RepID=UPI0009227512|nr:ATPase [Fibrobacter sp. UWB12]SHK99940.1 hypothetical protein SAMN05720759_11221 [Fibrobacter sp. UWB12]